MIQHTIPTTPNSDVLNNRVVLITGAYGGLGEAAALACARAGAQLVLLGRKVPKLNRVYDAVKALGPEPALYPLDMRGASPIDYQQMAEKIVAECGGLHGVLHCAADFSGLTPLANTEPDEFVTSMHVNFTAPWLLTQACLPALRAAQDSAVVFVIDDAARVARAYWGAYGLAKQAQINLMRMLHDETESSTIRVSALQPGPMRTGLRAKAYLNEQVAACPLPELYAPACVHLLSSAGIAQRGQVWTPNI